MAASTILAWPLSGHERMASEAASTALLRAEAGGVLGGLSPARRERLRSVLQAMSGFVQAPDLDGVLTGGHWREWGQMQHFMRVPGRTAAESLKLAKDALWGAADEAVFWFRKDETTRAKSSLGNALHALQDSFSPAHVRREPDAEGRQVIKDLSEYTAQDPKEHHKGDETYKTGEAAESPYSGLGKAAVLASTLLLAYFIQRCAGNESDATGIRSSLDDLYLRGQVS
jgi:hypothetical protein